MATISITVNAVNDVPVASDDSYVVLEDTQLIVGGSGVLTNDNDVDRDGLTAIWVTDPSHGTLALNPDGSFTYIPDINFNGTDTFTYKTSDGMLESNTATVTITITAANDAPIAQNNTYSTQEDTPLTVGVSTGVLANDYDVEGTGLTAIWLRGPGNGLVTLNQDGSFTYTPDPNFFGVDTFYYQVTDGLLQSGEAMVQITVNSVNDAPLANNDSYMHVGGYDSRVGIPWSFWRMTLM